MKKADGFIISPLLHGTFAEYYGKTIYDGIWVGKDSEIENVNGIRKDVIDGCIEAGITAFRWPGGCCAEKYHWQDGVGKERMPRMHFSKDAANGGIWRNDFGTDECVAFCRLTGMEPMFVANVTSGTPDEFYRWYEYCNGDVQTKYGAMRAQNGYPEPYNITLWGIGNTDENTWKANWDPIPYSRDFLRFCTAIDYERIGDIKTVGLGLSIRHGVDGFVQKSLDYITMNGALKGPDYLSVHHYLGSMKDARCGDAVDYSDEEYYYLLNSLQNYQSDIDAHRKIIAEHTSERYPTYIAMDEWGTWHSEATVESGQRQRQTLRDAVFAALALHIFYRNCDIVKIAMETQLCNLLQSLFETDGKNFMRTPTFWVMKLYQEHLGQTLLKDAVTVTAGACDVIASASQDDNRVTVTLVNISLTEEATVRFAPEINGMQVTLSDIIRTEDIHTYNTYENPNAVCTKPFAAKNESVIIPTHSIVRIVFTKEKSR